MQIPPDALIPQNLKNTKLSDSLSDAQSVARDLARLMDEAHRKNKSVVELPLSKAYSQVYDKGEIYDAMTMIVTTVRNSLSRRATNVKTIKVYFGSKLPKNYH